MLNIIDFNKLQNKNTFKTNSAKNLAHVSFGGISSSKLSPLAKDTVSLSKPFLQKSKEEVFKIIEEAIKDKNNFLGEGGEAKTYLIPNENCCVRILKDYPKAYKTDFSLDLNEEDKVNHVIAKLGNGSTIMKYIEGFPLFPLTRVVNPKTSKEISEAISTIGADSYNKLLKQVCEAKDIDMIFDCSWTNVILNPKDKTLTAIDFYKMDEKFPEIVRPLRHMYSAIPHNTYAEKASCCGKIILAGLQEMEAGVKPCLSISEFRFANFIDKVIEDMGKRETKPLEQLKDVLTDIECIKIKEYVGEDVTKELNGKLKVARCLVKQIFDVSS